jgi:hypothetical protein
LGNGTQSLIAVDSAPAADSSDTRLLSVEADANGNVLGFRYIATLPAPRLELSQYGLNNESHHNSHDVRVSAMDFTNDGLLDAIVFSRAGWNGNEWPIMSQVQFLQNLGNGQFSDVTSSRLIGYELNSSISYTPIIRDINLDGLPDIFLSEPSWAGTYQSTTILLAQQDGTFVDTGRQQLSSYIGSGGIASLVSGPNNQFSMVIESQSYGSGNATVRTVPLFFPDRENSEVLHGTIYNDLIYGLGGSDSINAGAGNDTLDGGLGYDTATYTGNKNQYSVTFNAGTGVYTISDTVANRDGVDTLASIEKLQFANEQLYLNNTPISSIQSIGLSPDGQSLLIRVDDTTQSVPLGSTISFNGSDVTTTELTNTMSPVQAFTDNANNGYILPTVYSGPVGFLEYQLFDDSDGAVVTAPVGTNDFIYLSSTNTAANKATNGNGGQDVIAGGVGSSFIAGGTNHNSTFFLDGRADGVSWSTITDFIIGTDNLTIFGWNPGASSLNTTNPIINGAAGYTGLTLYINNLAPDGSAANYVNPALNQVTLSNHTLNSFGYDSITALNSALQSLSQQAMNNSGADIIASYTASNGHFTVGQTTDNVGVGIHWYLNVH